MLDTFFREDERRIRAGRVPVEQLPSAAAPSTCCAWVGGHSMPESADWVNAGPRLLLPLLGLPWDN